MELIQYPDNPWFNDPYAASLAGEFGRQFLAKMGVEIKSFGGSKSSNAGQTNMLISTSTRTKVIDDYMLDSFDAGFQQVVVFGAGLCTRP